MRLRKTSELVPGMIVADDVFTYNHQLILQKGLVLTEKTITRLEFYSILSIKVDDEVLPLRPTEADTSSYSEQIRASASFQEFKMHYDTTVETFQVFLTDLTTHRKEVDTNHLFDDLLSLLNTSQGKVNVFNMLHNIRSYDDHTYVHSINVALICYVFANWLHMSDDEIYTATLAGLLHDLGKITVPESIMQKPGKLTSFEMEQVKKHPYDGYRVLQKSQICDHIKNSALMHHERCDGSGYPLGLSSDKIDLFAKIVAIADVYDAMTSKRIHRGAICPFEVIELFETDGYKLYDPKYLLTFLENIVNTYMQQRVELNTGEIGEIVLINRNRFSRPMVKCGETFYDLAAMPQLSITKIL